MFRKSGNRFSEKNMRKIKDAGAHHDAAQSGCAPAMAIDALQSDDGITQGVAHPVRVSRIAGIAVLLMAASVLPFFISDYRTFQFALAVATPQILKYKGIEHWTGGVQGIVILKPPAPFGLPISPDKWLYLFSLAVAVVMFLLGVGILRGRVGRALIA